MRLLLLPLIAAQVPPPVIVVDGPRGSAEELHWWRADGFSCGGVGVTPVVAPDPLPELRFGTSGGPVRVRFSIDASGRPLGISLPPGDYQARAGDLGPALAASRFAAGAPRAACEAVFTAEHMPWTQTPVAAAMRYTIFPTGRRAREAFDRARPAGSTCFDPAPAVLTRSYPDFATVPREPGRMGWSMVGFDLDAHGRPVAVRHVAGSGNRTLDATSAVAVAQSRFAVGARRGCLYPYYVNAGDMPAPPPPSEASFRAATATCPATAAWARRPVYSFPPNYNRRHIEGWAIVQYDVAPWGDIGNARVLAAEPAEAFGDAALAVLRGARWQPSRGYVGCVDRVRFVIASADTGPAGTVTTD